MFTPHSRSVGGDNASLSWFAKTAKKHQKKKQAAVASMAHLLIVMEILILSRDSFTFSSFRFVH